MSKQEKYWVGFDLGGTKMLAAVFDEEFEIRGQRRRRTRGGDGAKAGVERLCETIEQALKEAEIEPAQLAGIGVGCPGPVDCRHGVVLEMANLGWRDVPLKKQLEEAFSCPAEVINDVDAGVFGEYRFGAARDALTAIGVFPGTGIGGGCVYDGTIFSGDHISCMEIGHMEVDPGGAWCGCGRRGCLETVASRLAISAEVAKAVYRGEAPYLADETGSNLAELRSGVLARAIRKGDAVVEQIIRTAAGALGRAVANVVHLMAPDLVVLGGGLVEAMPELWVDEVLSHANERVMQAYRDTFRVAAAELGDNAGILGAAAWVKRAVAQAEASK